MEAASALAHRPRRRDGASAHSREENHRAVMWMTSSAKL